ncbi:MAG: hypothetical protein Q8L64_03740 [bacterium]|nr:hypothetical protein [bacterium]
MNKYKSKITPILLKLAEKYNAEFHVMDHDSDAGYIVGQDHSRHYFSYGTLDLNNDAATDFARSKILSSEVVSAIRIRVPKEKMVKFSINLKAPIISVLEEIGTPAIIKPVHGAQGKNIFKIDSLNNFELVIKNNDLRDDLIIQEYIDSPNEIRVVLLDGEVIQAYKRDYACVIGDAVKTIKELIEEKNKYFQNRQRNTVIDTNDTQIAVILQQRGYDLNYILQKNERLNISYGRNLSRGGEYEFITKLSPIIIEVSKKIAEASALRLVGIDLFVVGDLDHVESENQIIFIEYNASPDMENNFYYDAGYEQQLFLIYEKIFSGMCKYSLL